MEESIEIKENPPVTEISKTTRREWMLPLVGVVGLFAFVSMIFIVAFVQIPSENKDIFNIITGGVFSMSTTIFSYYFGSSSGSKDKSDTIKKIVNS